MRMTKYLSFPIQDRNELEALVDNNLQIIDVQIKYPNDPEQLIPAKVINYKL